MYLDVHKIVLSRFGVVAHLILAPQVQDRQLRGLDVVVVQQPLRLAPNNVVERGAQVCEELVRRVAQVARLIGDLDGLTLMGSR